MSPTLTPIDLADSPLIRNMMTVGRPVESPPTPSPAERLKAIMESAPAALLVLKSDGKLLAANRCALALLGAGRLDDVLGQTLADRVLPEHRQAVTDFVDRVCHGESGALKYQVVGSGDTPRPVEMHAIPLPREGTGSATFLGATWDVSQWKRSTAAASDETLAKQRLQAQCDALGILASVTDRRGSVRRPLDQCEHILQVKVRAEHVRVINISGTGALIECAAWLRLTDARLKIVSADGDLWVTGRVMRSMVVDLSRESVVYRVAIAFKHPLSLIDMGQHE